MRKLLLTCLAIATVTLACDKKTPTGPDTITIPGPDATIPAPPAQTTAAFVFSPNAPRLNQAVAFNAVQSAAPVNHVINAYGWDFGDGGVGQGVNAAHTYGVEGVYNVILTVTDDVGKTATVSHPVTVGGTLSTTTTTIGLSSRIAHYVSTQVGATVPSDMTLNFRVSSSGQSSSLRTKWNSLRPQAEAIYDVQGVFSTVSGMTGTVQGSFTGAITPDISGSFNGTLIGNLPGCFAERVFEGATTQLLDWAGGATRRNTCGQGDTNSPLNFPSVTLVRTETPPPNTPLTSTTTTTSVQPPGTLTGIVVDASTGQPVAGATVAVTGGSSAVTNATGAFSISNVPAGSRNVQVTAPLYVARIDSVTIASGTSTAYSPALTHITGDLRIVLRWGASPEDLDLHLVIPDGTEVNYQRLNPVPFASLDVDDNEGGVGPETITVTPSTGGLFAAGLYSVYVHNFTAFQPNGRGTPGFDSSSPAATIAVDQAGTPIAQFVASAAGGNAVTSPEWSVFTFRLAATPSGNIAITPVQQFIDRNFIPNSDGLRAKPLRR